jgi:hypothetical protein
MQNLEFANKKSTNNQNQKIVSKKSEELENKREGKGRSLATSHMIYRIQNTDTYYVQSERSENTYYFVRYNFGVLEWCSCPDNSIRGIKCKHQFAIEYAIRLGTLKDIDKLPKEAERFTNQQIEELEAVSYHSYRDDQYDF